MPDAARACYSSVLHRAKFCPALVSDLADDTDRLQLEGSEGKWILPTFQNFFAHVWWARCKMVLHLVLNLNCTIPTFPKEVKAIFFVQAVKVFVRAATL